MSNLHLAIYLTRSVLHIVEITPHDSTIQREFDFELVESNDIQYKQQLSKHFDSIDLHNDYAEYTLAWGTEKQTLVPLRVYNESNAKDIFHLMFGYGIEDQTIDFNRLMELSLVSVFELPDWVKSFFIMKYPTISIKHENAMLLRAIFQGATFKQKIIITLNKNYIDLNISFHNELIFNNSFSYQNATDILYHLLFVLQQNEIDNKEGEILLLTSADDTKSIALEVEKLLKQHYPIKKLGTITISSVLKLHTLCV